MELLNKMLNFLFSEDMDIFMRYFILIILILIICTQIYFKLTR